MFGYQTGQINTETLASLPLVNYWIRKSVGPFTLNVRQHPSVSAALKQPVRLPVRPVL